MNKYLKNFGASTISVTILLPVLINEFKTTDNNEIDQITYVKPYENYYSYEKTDYAIYSQLLDFTSKLIAESRPLEKEFSDLIDINFENLL